MLSRATASLTVAVLVCLIPLTSFALLPFSQDFEGLDQSDPNALASDGWLVYGSVFTPGGDLLYGYGSFPAPNHNVAFCEIVQGEGGLDQGFQQLVVFSDYENLDHANGNIIESNVFQEQTVGPGDIGQSWVFEFNAKLGNIEGNSTAAAFIKTLDPDNNYAIINIRTVDMTSIPVTWSGFLLSIWIDPSLDGKILQFGFLNTASNYEGSGIFYDNVNFYQSDIVNVPDVSVASGPTLRQNYPNPFNPKTWIEFTLDRAGMVDISVFDVAGRKIATLQQGELAAGEHQVTWNGRTDRGNPAPAGRYQYLLNTATGQVSRSMVLLK
jgi:hypothetical protein